MNECELQKSNELEWTIRDLSSQSVLEDVDTIHRTERQPSRMIEHGACSVLKREWQCKKKHVSN